jgi:peroxiredoxin Q/BCP
MGIRDRLRAAPDRFARALGLVPSPPAVGAAAPALDVADASGRVWSLSELRGAPFVLYFYPKDDTPGCTREACDLRDALVHHPWARVLGASADAATSHHAFAQKFALPFPLLVDADGALARRWGAAGLDGAPRRVTFVVDRAGLVARVFDPVDVRGHADAVIAALEPLLLR